MGRDLISFDLRADLEAHRPPGGHSMAFSMTLHISRPCMLCAPSRRRGLGGAGSPPCRGSGGEGGGGRRPSDTRRWGEGGGG